MARKNPAWLHFGASTFWWVICTVGFYLVFAEKFANLPVVKVSGFFLILLGGFLGLVNYNIAREFQREPW